MQEKRGILHNIKFISLGCLIGFSYNMTKIYWQSTKDKAEELQITNLEFFSRNAHEAKILEINRVDPAISNELNGKVWAVPPGGLAMEVKIQFENENQMKIYPSVFETRLHDFRVGQIWSIDISNRPYPHFELKKDLTVGPNQEK